MNAQFKLDCQEQVIPASVGCQALLPPILASVSYTSMHQWVLNYSQEDHPFRFLVDHLVLESLCWILPPGSPLSRFPALYSLGPQVLTITAPHLVCLLFLCGPCSSPCRNCWSYLLHPSSSLEGEWNLDPLDRSWLEEGICLHYVTISKPHPLLLSSSPLWSFFPWWGVPGIPPGTKMALTLLYWWHHCHLGGWGGWFRVTPLVADRESYESVAHCNVFSLDRTSCLNKEPLKSQYPY